jgi:CheY-like chemotaxis protein
MRAQPVEIGVLLEEFRPFLSSLVPSMIGFEVSGLQLGEAATVCIDPALFELVLEQLVVNGVEALDGRGGAIRVCAERARLADGADVARIVVEDTGIGMDEETARRALDPFFSTKETGRAVGLGLAVACGIVEQSGGTIALTSRPSCGTRVELLLPLYRPSERPPRGVDAAAVGVVQTVLVAEDEATLRELLVLLLLAEGYRVHAAADGEIALALFEQHEDEVDLVITDVAMPRVDGVELAGQIGARQPALPILFISGYAQNVVALSGRRVLSKPFSPDELLSAVREHARDRSADA